MHGYGPFAWRAVEKEFLIEYRSVQNVAVVFNLRLCDPRFITVVMIVLNVYILYDFNLTFCLLKY